jgi:hypothetical protein
MVQYTYFSTDPYQWDEWCLHLISPAVPHAMPHACIRGNVFRAHGDAVLSWHLRWNLFE